MSLTKIGLDTICAVSIERGDGLFGSLEADKQGDHLIHENCRCDYVHRRNIGSQDIGPNKVTSCEVHSTSQGFQSSELGTNDSLGNDSALLSSSFDFSKCCIICGKSVVRVARHLISVTQTHLLLKY